MLGEKVMLTFKNPPQAANHIRHILKVLQKEHAVHVFPVEVKDIALELSKQWYPDEPISLIHGTTFTDHFNGVLRPLSEAGKPKKWGILYNEFILSNGRINFTIAHEFGHYLLHRSLSKEGFQCSNKDMIDWQDRELEYQANEFASYLLMPLDDIRLQIGSNLISPELIEYLVNRYMVSRVAFLLKWISMTEERAQLVISEDGYFKWAKSSHPLYKSGIFYKKGQFKEAPKEAAFFNAELQTGKWLTERHGSGVWEKEEVAEMSFQSYDQEGKITLSLLIFPKNPPANVDYNPDSIERRTLSR